MDRRLVSTIEALREIGFDELYIVEEEDRQRSLKELFEKLRGERRCVFYEGARDYVFGDGNPYSSVVFVGEAPGEEEDKQGKPFVGRAGRLLNQKLEEVGLRREEVYITNVVKSRPPGNRKPTREEMASCIPYLKKELEIIRPKLIVCLGATALEGILGKSLPINKHRGQLFEYPYNRSVKVLLTYHPAYVLRNPSSEGEFTKDLRMVVELLRAFG
ncbi:MAG: uracil-DNA glycosylase [Acidobacteria bacterium]|jgi:DNA polymerase|nr:MAG: uracil-DNA glycosylase [Acidobacteriota bacterium]